MRLVRKPEKVIFDEIERIYQGQDPSRLMLYILLGIFPQVWRTYIIYNKRQIILFEVEQIKSSHIYQSGLAVLADELLTEILNLLKRNLPKAQQRNKRNNLLDWTKRAIHCGR